MDYKSGQIINFKTRYRKNKLKKSLKVYGALFMVGIISFFISWLWTTPLLAIQQVKVKGVSRDSQKFIAQKINQDEILKQHFFHINPLYIKNDLETYPLISQVQVKRWFFPTRLELEIVEREVFLKLLVLNNNFDENAPESTGKYVFIDRNGIILPLQHDRKPLSKFSFALNVPIVKINDDDIQTEKVDIDKLAVINSILDYYEKNSLEETGTFYIKNLQNIILKRDDMVYWMGKIENFDKKLNLIPHLLPLAKKYKEKVKYIDVRLWQYPVIKIQKSGESNEDSNSEKSAT